MSAKLDSLSEVNIEKVKNTRKSASNKASTKKSVKAPKVEVIVNGPRRDIIAENPLDDEENLVEVKVVKPQGDKKKRTIRNIKPSKKEEPVVEEIADEVIAPKKKKTLHLNLHFGIVDQVEQIKPEETIQNEPDEPTEVTEELVVEEPEPIDMDIIETYEIEQKDDENLSEVSEKNEDLSPEENADEEVFEEPAIEESNEVPSEEKIEIIEDHVPVEAADGIDEDETTFVVYEEKARKVDNSIIQSAPFFYTPSVFEKFNLEISSADDDSSSEPIIKETFEPEVINVTEPDVVDSATLVEEFNKPVEEMQENHLDDITDELIDEIIKNNDDILLDVAEDASSKEGKEENDVLIQNVISELTEAAENIETFEAPKAEANVNKFFDSSIPTLPETAAAPKVKKPLSPIFKRFTFDEAVMQKAIPDLSTPIISETALPVTDIVNNDVPSSIVADTIVPEVQVSADPVKVATPVETDINIAVADTTTEKPEVITVVNNNVPNSPISIDEELVEKILDEEKKANQEENISNESDEDIDQENDIENLDEENDEEIDLENSNSLDILPEPEEDSDEDDDLDIEEYHLDDNIDYDTIVKEAEAEKEKEQEQEQNNSDESFSIESYFGLDNISDEEPEAEAESEEPVELDISPIDDISEDDQKDNPDFNMIAKLLETFNDSINTLSDKISGLDDNKQKTNASISPASSDDSKKAKETEPEISDDDLVDLLINDDSLLAEEGSAEKQEPGEPEANIVEDILSDVLLSDNSSVNDEMRNDLISEVLSAENDSKQNNSQDTDSQVDTDFAKVLECLTKAITDLEAKPEASAKKDLEPEKEPVKEQAIESTAEVIAEPEKIIEEEPSIISETPDAESGDGKSVNILIDNDDIFSIQILNETYEIMADFDSISVLSENLNISTPKNNFYVKIGEKYIEIHNNKTYFTVQTNFEDIEFANAINNVGFAKKHNRIELNIKEAFKLSSVNNKVELSMLNKTIASIKDVPVTEIDEKSLSDNRTLIISEETQKVYLPYTISEIMEKLKYNDNYKSLQDVVDNEYTLPLSTFKMPIVSRFREAYRFMRTKEKSSVYAAVDLAVELMFNSNLDPAIIRAAKDLKELNVYLDCLYENEVEKFDCFKIVYKVLPKIK